MIPRRLDPLTRRTATWSLLLLLTAGATWLWAHAGHAPLPTKGAQVNVEKGELTLSPSARAALDVRTAEVELRPMADKLLAYATLVSPWQRHAFATTRLPGRIDKMSVKPGQAVAAGQALAEVQSLELENLQLELVNAQNDIDLSTKVLDSYAQGAKSGTIPEQRLWEASAKHQENLNALEIAKSKWLSLGLGPKTLEELLRRRDSKTIGTLAVRSPIAGTVIHADLNVGKVVEPNEHLFEIVDLSTVWVKIGVLEQDLHRIREGLPVELTLSAYPGQVFSAPIQVKGLYIDPRTHLGTAWGELKNPPGQEPRFLPGMVGQANILLPAAQKMTTVPAEAVINDGLDRYVLVEAAASAEASQYQKQNVTIGLQTPEFVQVQGAVFPGDRVVTRGSHELAGFFVPGVLRLSDAAKKNIGLIVETVRPRLVEDVVEIDGAVDVPPDRRAFASAQIPGSLAKILVEQGQKVRAGEVLAEVASLELQNLQLDLLRAQLQTNLLEESLKRLRSIEGALPQRQLWETQSLYNATRNRRDNLERKLEAVGLSRAQVEALLKDHRLVEALPVRAPIDGTLVHFDKALGQVVKAEEPLFDVHDLSRVWVQGFVPARDIVRLGLDEQRPNEARVRLVADPGFLGTGKVQRSGRIFGADDRTLSVWVELDGEPKALQHNMLARLTIPVRKPAATLAVPLGAIVRDGLRAYVFVQKTDGTFERRPVETGRADDRHVEITSGLHAGDPVAVRGSAELQTAYVSLR
ncbi:MAG: efflux RND transporter periplasmic adaptor subunit [Gemmataceae bacterium]|nr:efflux RND transporter periplasmic adaptor subunit [Gemmataceae bacterium]